MPSAEDVVKVLRESPKTSKELAIQLDSDANDLQHAGWNYIHRAKREDPTLESKISKRWVDGVAKYYITSVDNERLYDAVAETSDTLYEGTDPREGVDIAHEREEDMLLVIVSDLHIGHKYVAYKQIKRDFEKMAEYPDKLKIVGLGDLIDNSQNTHAPQGSQNLVDKNEQLDMVQHLFSILDEDQILRLYEGNHEIRSWISDHFLPNKWLALQEKSGYGYFAEPFIIDINGKKWKLYMRHKAVGSSQYNNIHNCVRTCLFDGSELARDADIIVTAHAHQPGRGVWVVGGKKRWMMSTPCMVRFDDYAERKGWTSGQEMGIPAIYLSDDREPIMYDDFSQGIDEWL